MRSTITPGQRFGRLVVIEETEPSVMPSTTHRRFACICDCGETCAVRMSKLRSGHTQSCGCLQRERTSEVAKTIIKHGYVGHPLYTKWQMIKRRCFNPNNPSYKHYGARGITMDPAWVNDAGAFIDYIIGELGSCPEGMSLDRIDNDGDYVPGNLKWSTNSEQQLNTRRSIARRAELTA